MENLKLNWTKKEMTSFKNLTNDLLGKIQSEQIVCPYANKKLGIKKGVVHKNVSLFYKEDRVNEKIYLVTFFNNRVNPKTLNKLLRQ
jgi:hypothetical protein